MLYPTVKYLLSSRASEVKWTSNPPWLAAPMLQNVRAKVKGFETTMAVSKLPGDEALARPVLPSAPIHRHQAYSVFARLKGLH